MKRYTKILLGLLSCFALVQGLQAETTKKGHHDRARPSPPFSWSLERTTQLGAMSQGSLSFSVPVDSSSVQLLMLGGSLQELRRHLNPNGRVTSIDYSITVDTQLKTQPLISLIVNQGDDRKPIIGSYQLEVSDFHPEQIEVVDGLVLLPVTANIREE